MEYRTIKKTGTKVSTVGIGCGHLVEADAKTLDGVIGYGYEQGVNLIDMAFTHPEPLNGLANAIEGKRDSFVFQMHLGCIFKNGRYTRSRDLNDVREGFESQLAQLKIGYADIACFHCVDEDEDFDKLISSGVFEYGLWLRQKGIIRNLGFASHNVDMANRFLDTGEIDQFLFSINPAYDLDPVANYPMGGEWIEGNSRLMAQRRRALYQRCETEGVGITVMKAFGGGRLLDARTSPLGSAMTIPQCLQYALDRPAVVSCLVGVKNREELNGVLCSLDMPPEDKDYSFLSKMQIKELSGQCIYCNHCLPCPSDINIGLLSKYLDLAQAGDEMAAQHYLALSKRASDCVQCGACEKNCPFGVGIRDRMKHAVKIFGV